MARWSGEPAYRQVAADLRAQIRDGRLKVGSQLPSIAALMHRYEVSISVVRMALSELRNEGLVVTHQGKGAFVTARPAGAEHVSPSSPEFETIMQRLEAVHAHLTQLDDRLERVEQRVDSPQGSKPRSGRARPLRSKA